VQQAFQVGALLGGGALVYQAYKSKKRDEYERQARDRELDARDRELDSRDEELEIRKFEALLKAVELKIIKPNDVKKEITDFLLPPSDEEE
jgi:uncharacterized membrane protein YebE (DUF533 family)